MEPPLDRDSNWVLTATGGPSKVPRGFHPLGDEWTDVAAREQSIGIPEGRPVLLASHAVDYRLADYFREAFRTDRGSTARTYASELRTWFRFLDRHELAWDEATRDEVRSFQIWRVYDDRNPRPVSPATWNKGWAALVHFYGWAHRRGWVAENPVGDQDRLRDPSRPSGHREKNSRVSRDRWILPAEFVLWRDVGFRSYSAVREPNGLIRRGTIAETARPRNSGRNSSFADFLISTGLRLDEAASLLSFELPTHVDEEVLVLGKGGVTRHYRVMHDLGIHAINDYRNGERRAAIRKARRDGRYAAVANPVEVTRIVGRTTTQVVRLTDGRQLSVATMKKSDRLRLFVRNGESIEPAWFWLTEGGTPMDPTSWEKTFDLANKRVTAARARAGVVSPGVRVTPHSLRFTFALLVLLAGVRAIDRELGIGSSGAFNIRNYTQAFDEVQHLLGHAHQDTTRAIYLEPLKGLRRSSIMSSGSLDEMWASLTGPGSLIGFGAGT